jgi:hypothetical protein
MLVELVSANITFGFTFALKISLSSARSLGTLPPRMRKRIRMHAKVFFMSNLI